MADDNRVYTLTFTSNVGQFSIEINSGTRKITGDLKALENAEVNLTSITAAEGRKRTASRKQESDAAANTNKARLSAINESAGFPPATERQITSLSGTLARQLAAAQARVDPFAKAIRQAEADIATFQAVIEKINIGVIAKDSDQAMAAINGLVGAYKRLSDIQEKQALSGGIANDNLSTLDAAARRLRDQIDPLSTAVRNYGEAIEIADTLQKANRITIEEFGSAARLAKINFEEAAASIRRNAELASVSLTEAANRLKNASTLGRVAGTTANNAITSSLTSSQNLSTQLRTDIVAGQKTDPAVLESTRQLTAELNRLAVEEESAATAATQLKNALDPVGAVERELETTLQSYLNLLGRGKITVDEFTVAQIRAKDAASIKRQDVSGVTAGQDDYARLAKSAQQYRETLNPLLEAQRKYSAAINETKEFVSVGLVPQREAAVRIDDYTKKLSNVEGALQKANAGQLSTAQITKQFGPILQSASEDFDRFASSTTRSFGLNRIGFLQLQAAGVNAFQALASGMSPVRVAITEGAQVIGSFIQGIEGGFKRLIALAPGIALIGVAFTGIAAVGGRLLSVSQNIKEFNVQLQTFGLRSQLSGKDAQEMSDSLRKLGISAADAKAGLQAVFSTPGINPQRARDIVTLAQDISALPGRGDVKTETEGITKALTGGVEETIKFGTALGSLNATQIESIRNTARNKSAVEALGIAFGLIRGNIQAADATMSPFGKAVRDLTNTFNEFIGTISESEAVKNFVDRDVVVFVNDLSEGFKKLKEVVEQLKPESVTNFFDNFKKSFSFAEDLKFFNDILSAIESISRKWDDFQEALGHGRPSGTTALPTATNVVPYAGDVTSQRTRVGTTANEFTPAARGRGVPPSITTTTAVDIAQETRRDSATAKYVTGLQNVYDSTIKFNEQLVRSTTSVATFDDTSKKEIDANASALSRLTTAYDLATRAFEQTPQVPATVGGMATGGAASVTRTGNFVTAGQLDQSFDAALNNMIAAAKEAGIEISKGSGFRTTERQGQLYAADVASHGGMASGMVARPGSSQHERGLAMDLVTPGGALLRGNAAADWVTQNASLFGLTNRVVAGEPWHVEPIGGRTGRTTGGTIDLTSSTAIADLRTSITTSSRAGVAPSATATAIERANAADIEAARQTGGVVTGTPLTVADIEKTNQAFQDQLKIRGAFPAQSQIIEARINAEKEASDRGLGVNARKVLVDEAVANATKLLGVEADKASRSIALETEGTLKSVDAFGRSESAGLRALAAEQARQQVQERGGDQARIQQDILTKNASLAVLSSRQQLSANEPVLARQEALAQAALKGAAAEHEQSLENEVLSRTYDGLSKATAAFEQAQISGTDADKAATRQTLELARAQDATARRQVRGTDTAQQVTELGHALQINRDQVEIIALQISLQGRTTEEITKQTALLQLRQQLGEKSNSLSDEQKQAWVESTARVQDYNAALMRAQREQERINSLITDIASNISSSLISAIDDAFDGKKVTDWGEKVKTIIKDLTKTLAEQLVIKPLLGSIAGGLGFGQAAQNLGTIGGLGGAAVGIGGNTTTGAVGLPTGTGTIGQALGLANNAAGGSGLNLGGGLGNLGGVGNFINENIGSALGFATPSFGGLSGAQLAELGVPGTSGGLFGGTTLTGALGGIGAGVGAGGLISSLFGGNSTIGSAGGAVGGAIGNLILPGIGGILGGALGGLTGLFGNNTPSNNPAGADLNLVTGLTSRVSTSADAASNQNVQQISDSLQAFTKQITQLTGKPLSLANTTVDIQAGVRDGIKLGFGGSTRAFGDATSAINAIELEIAHNLTGLSSSLTTVLSKITDPAQIQDAVTFALQYDNLKKAADSAFSSIQTDTQQIGPFAAAMETLGTTFTDMSNKANQFGLSLDPINKGLAEATRRLQTDFRDSLNQAFDSASSKEYINTLRAVGEAFRSNTREAQAIGLEGDIGVTSKIAQLEVSKARDVLSGLDAAQLNEAYAALKDTNPEIGELAKSMIEAGTAATDATQSITTLADGIKSLDTLATSLRTGSQSGLTGAAATTAAIKQYSKDLDVAKAAGTAITGTQVANLATSADAAINASLAAYGNAPATADLRRRILDDVNVIQDAAKKAQQQGLSINIPASVGVEQSRVRANVLSGGTSLAPAVTSGPASTASTTISAASAPASSSIPAELPPAASELAAASGFPHATGGAHQVGNIYYLQADENGAYVDLTKVGANAKGTIAPTYIGGTSIYNMGAVSNDNRRSMYSRGVVSSYRDGTIFNNMPSYSTGTISNSYATGTIAYETGTTMSSSSYCGGAMNYGDGTKYEGGTSSYMSGASNTNIPNSYEMGTIANYINGSVSSYIDGTTTANVQPYGKGAITHKELMSRTSTPTYSGGEATGYPRQYMGGISPDATTASSAYSTGTVYNSYENGTVSYWQGAMPSVSTASPYGGGVVNNDMHSYWQGGASTPSYWYGAMSYVNQKASPAYEGGSMTTSSSNHVASYYAGDVGVSSTYVGGSISSYAGGSISSYMDGGDSTTTIHNIPKGGTAPGKILVGEVGPEWMLPKSEYAKGGMDKWNWQKVGKDGPEIINQPGGATILPFPVQPRDFMIERIKGAYADGVDGVDETTIAVPTGFVAPTTTELNAPKASTIGELITEIRTLHRDNLSMSNELSAIKKQIQGGDAQANIDRRTGNSRLSSIDTKLGTGASTPARRAVG